MVFQSIPLLTPCCDSYKVIRISNTIGVQLQRIQYVFQNKSLSKDSPSFQRRGWLKNERDNDVETRYSMSITKHGECEWDGIWSMKWMRWKWMTKWISWTDRKISTKRLIKVRSFLTIFESFIVNVWMVLNKPLNCSNTDN